MTLSVASWNVNSVRKRLDGLKALADEHAPDVICLQETKVTDDLFPAVDIAAMGYPHQAIHGIKGYNGVAILSKLPLEHIETAAWCGKADGRHIYCRLTPAAGTSAGKAAGGPPPLEIHSLYVPAGGDVADPLKNPKFAHKLDFITELTHWWAARGPADGRKGTPARILAGDFNVAPLPTDVWSHERLKNIVTHTEIEITHLDALQRAGGWVDAVRRLIPEDDPVFTWWSYRARDWAEADKGRRLDHIWVSQDLEAALERVDILRHARDWDPPSDHVPVILTLSA